MSSQKNKVLPSRVLAAIAQAETFGERLKAAWQLTGNRVEDLTETLGLGKNAIWQWGRGKYTPEPESLNKLCSELGVPRGLLLFGQGRSMRTRLANNSGLGEILFKALGELSTGKAETQVEKEFHLESGRLKEFVLSLYSPYKRFVDRGYLLLWLAKDPATPEVTNTQFIKQLDWGEQFDLTTREVRVLRLLIEGKSKTAIAEYLGEDLGTIIRDVGTLKVKLGVTDKKQSTSVLIGAAVEKGFPTVSVGLVDVTDEIQRAVLLFKSGIFQWGGVSAGVKRFFVESLATYLKKPVAELNSGDFTVRLPDLGFKTLRGLTSYYEQQHGLSRVDAMDKLLEELGYKPENEAEEYINSLKSSRLRDWSVVPKAARLAMVEVLAAHLDKPVSEIRPIDFTVKVPKFGGKTLTGLRDIYQRESQGEVSTVRALLLDLGVEPAFGGKQLGPNEALDALCSGRFRTLQVVWPETTTEARRYLLALLAWDLNKMPEALTTTDMRRKVPSFKGYTLLPLLTLFKKEQETWELALIELKHSLGFEDARVKRKSRSLEDLTYDDINEVVDVIGDPFRELEENAGFIRPLNNDEEVKLAELIQKGNRAAYWILVGSQANYLRTRAWNIFLGSGTDGGDILVDEMILAGQEVIERSALFYTPAKGAKLSSFTWRFVGRAMAGVIYQRTGKGFQLYERVTRDLHEEEDGAKEDVLVALASVTLHPDTAVDTMYRGVFLDLLGGKATNEVANQHKINNWKVRQIRKEVLAALKQYRSNNGSNANGER